MNNFFKLLPVFLFVLFLTACKKDKTVINTSTTVMVVNAAVNVPNIKVNINNFHILYSTATQVAYGASAYYFTPTAPSQVSVVSSTDTTHFLVNSTFNFRSTLYTMFIAGLSPATDTILKEETTFKFLFNDVKTIDSSINIRFVNLSPNSAPVNINIRNSATNEATNLGYKGITDFKNYPALIASGSYIFDIKDPATGALLFSYPFSITTANRSKNVALVIKGLTGTTSGTNALGVFPVNYF